MYKRKIVPMLLISIVMMVLLTACQNKEEAKKESTKQGIGNKVLDEAYAKVAELGGDNGEIGLDKVLTSQIGNFMVGDVELSDAKVIDESSDSIWMGYSEMELGFLTPEEMPNCYNSGEDVGL